MYIMGKNNRVGLVTFFGNVRYRNLKVYEIDWEERFLEYK